MMLHIENLHVEIEEQAKNPHGCPNYDNIKQIKARIAAKRAHLDGILAQCGADGVDYSAGVQLSLS